MKRDHGGSVNSDAESRDHLGKYGPADMQDQPDAVKNRERDALQQDDRTRRESDRKRAEAERDKERVRTSFLEIIRNNRKLVNVDSYPSGPIHNTRFFKVIFADGSEHSLKTEYHEYVFDTGEIPRVDVRRTASPAAEQIQSLLDQGKEIVSVRTNSISDRDDLDVEIPMAEIVVALGEKEG